MPDVRMNPDESGARINHCIPMSVKKVSLIIGLILLILAIIAVVGFIT